MSGELLLKNDPAALIEAVRESVLRKIEEINSEADAEIKGIENEISDEVEKFRASEQRKYDELAGYEESKAANLLSIQTKKQKLEVIESFISSMMSGAAEALRSDSRYPDFLKWSVLSALHDISGPGATVLLSPGDAEFSEVIMNEIRNSGCDVRINITLDGSIVSGGAMIIDDQSEVAFNNTVERIIYRKIDEIKRIIVRFINELTDGAGTA